MVALNMPVPNGLFVTLQTAIGTASTMLGAIKTIGADATVAELVGATTGLEALMVAGSILAVGYVGAVIGSLIIAADASLSCRNSTAVPAVVRSWSSNTRVAVPASILAFMRSNPEVLIDGPARHAYSFRMRQRKARTA
ncbi:hypothetical protein KTD55_04775 [Burkholderia gladioli]|uniref:hypothetical protein n=1 Tax=Burkholderia gladioli TaxID=28095 RepID=UPI001C232DB8|nr:hypothetical protein [Burkholderia gladioli]MBU9213366.1 hypothetical protein [Burkholderia gladioli]MDN7724345.1 hypothetical protein [Burkholderia gladioli]